MSESEEKFLSRWSRLKRDTVEASPPAPAPAEAQKPAGQEAPPPQLPPLESLTKDSDFSAFFQPKVDENSRRAALKILLSDPQFSVMDGLDIYFEDYSISESIPAEMLAQMKSAQKIFKWARGESDETEAPKTQEQSSPVEALAQVELPPDADSSAAVAAPAPDKPSAEVPSVALSPRSDIT